MLVHSDHRDTFILDGYFGTFKDSAYVKNLYNFTLGAENDGFSWSLAELELVAVAEGARAFVQGTSSLEGWSLCIILLRLDNVPAIYY